MAEILSLGEPMVEFNQLREGGREVYLPGYGGDTSNMAVAAARQGASIGYFTRLGQDTFGDMFMALWQAEGIDTSYVIRDPAAPTGIYFVTHSEAGHTFTYYRQGSAASLIKPAEVPTEAVSQAKALHLSGISQAISTSACDAVFRAIDIARAGGVTVSYDPNVRLKLWPLPRARAIVLETIAQCDLCLPNLEEAGLLTGLKEPQEIVDALLNRGTKVVALKLGAQGALVADHHQRHLIPGLSVATVDATGAGDTFDGAFLTELLRGVPLADAGRYANAAAALSTQGYGAVAPIPRRAEVEAFLAGQE